MQITELVLVENGGGNDVYHEGWRDYVTLNPWVGEKKNTLSADNLPLGGKHVCGCMCTWDERKSLMEMMLIYKEGTYLEQE